MTQRILFSTIICIASVVICLTPQATAQPTFEGISVSGSADLKQPAETMRMSVTIEAQGSDLKAAMESLLEKKKKATIQLEKLEATEGSIKFDDISTGEQGDTSQMMQQMKRRFGSDPRMAKMMKVKPPVKLSLTIKADWKLESGEASEMMLASDALKQKVIAVDFSGGSEDDKLSDEQAELAEEMSEMMNEYGGGGDTTPAGTPSFYYIRNISPELQAELLGKAFDDAKAQAERLAKATNLELGDIKTLSSRNASRNDYNDYYGYRQSSPTGETLEDGTVEAVSQSPDQVEYSVSVAASFGIKR